MARNTPTQYFHDARWIWPSALGRPVNRYVAFRQTFDCAGEPDARATLCIAADTVYAVWLNGEFVDTGRCPDVPPAHAFDTIPVGHALVHGHNELVVGLHVQGADSFQHIPGEPGVIFALAGNGVSAVSGRATRWRDNTAYRAGDMPRLTGQLGFTFEYTAARKPDAWLTLKAADIGPGADAMRLSPRPIPKTAVLPDIATTVVAQGVLRNASSETDAVPAQAMQRDFMSARAAWELFDAPADCALPLADGLRIAAHHLTEDGFYVIIDLGREDAGFFTLDVETDEGAIIDIGHGEHLDDLRVRAHVGNRNFANRYVCTDGRRRFTHWYKRMAGRYIQLNVRGARERFVLHYAGIRPALQPVAAHGAFAASDTRMDEIFQTSARTLRLCMHEHYEDCPWREQALYANDARNQALAGYYAFGECAFPAASFELLAKGLHPDGWLEMCMPANIDITIPSFTFSWVLAADEHLLYGGDVRFVRRMLPIVRTVLRARESELVNGLLPCPCGERYWQFYDWAPGLDGAERIMPGETRFDAVLNLYCCLAFFAGARLAEACGAQDDAARWRALGEIMRPRIHRRFWSADGAYRSYVGDRAFEHRCELVQALAISAGVTRNANAAAALCAKLVAGDPHHVETTLSQSLHKYNALFDSADPAVQRAAADAITAEWNAMLRRGATAFWETRRGAADFHGGGSLCHGWSAIPAYFYGAHVLGIRPTQPGFAAFTVAPAASGLAFASGRVDTPRGTIEVEWQRTENGFEGTVTHPATCVCVLSPRFTATIHTTGKKK